jgi:hypothetical protein
LSLNLNFWVLIDKSCGQGALAVSGKVGVRDFLAMTSEFHPEWSVFAVEASIEEVERALADFPQARGQDHDVPFYQQARTGSLHDKLQGRDIAYVVPVIKLAASPWIVVYWEVFYGGRTAQDWAKSISAKLSTRSISLFSADTSGVVGYELFDKGDHIESAHCCPQDNEGISTWKSKLRSKPELDFLEDVDEDFEGDDDEYEAELERVSHHNKSVWKNFLDQVFAGWGVYLPAFYPVSQSEGVRIEVESSSEKSIERVDLMYPVQNW